MRNPRTVRQTRQPGFAPGNEDNKAGRDFSPEKPCLLLSTDGICFITHYFVLEDMTVSTPQIVAGAIQMILALAVTIIIMMQEGNERGLGAISGGADTFFSKNSASSPQAKLRKNTTWLGIAFIVATIVLYVMVSLS